MSEQLKVKFEMEDGGVMIAELCASVVVVIIPIVILSQFVKKYLVRGLSFGSIK